MAETDRGFKLDWEYIYRREAEMIAHAMDRYSADWDTWNDTKRIAMRGWWQTFACMVAQYELMGKANAQDLARQYYGLSGDPWLAGHYNIVRGQRHVSAEQMSRTDEAIKRAKQALRMP